VLATALHLSLSWAGSVHFTSMQPISWCSLILFFHLRLGLLSGRFPSGFPTQTLYKCLLRTCHTPTPLPSQFSFDHSNNIWWVQIMKLPVMQSFPVPCYLISFRPKCLHQHSTQVFTLQMLNFVTKCPNTLETPMVFTTGRGDVMM
jgi:hypothetical protein